MPEAPNCPIYPTSDVWHSNIQNMPVHPMSATWIANMGGASRLLHPDFGGPYGYQLQVVSNATPTTRLAFDYADESDDVPYPFTASTPMGARFRLRSDFDMSPYSAQTRVVLTALQRYGLILADNGSNFFFQGQVDSRWSDQLISELKRIPAGAFDAVDASSLMVDPNSGLARGASGIALESGWHSRWLSQSDYLVMSPGQVANLWIRFTNTGTETWNRGIWGRQANLGLNADDKSPYRLGMAANRLWDDRIATTTVTTVAPGEVAEFRFAVRAPMTRGTYRLNLRPVIDGTVWMEDQGVFWLIVVP